jgi:hypothetical protein
VYLSWPGETLVIIIERDRQAQLSSARNYILSNKIIYYKLTATLPEPQHVTRYKDSLLIVERVIRHASEPIIPYPNILYPRKGKVT